MTNELKPVNLDANTVETAIRSLVDSTGIKVQNLFGATKFDISNPDVQKRLVEITNNLNLTDATSVTNLGKELGQITAAYTKELLTQVKTSQLGEVGAVLTELVTNTKKIQTESIFNAVNEAQKSNIPIIGGLIDKFRNRVDDKKINTESPEQSIERIEKVIDLRDASLQEKNISLENMFEGVLKESDETGYYIIAGQIHLLRQKEELKQLAEENADGTDQRLGQLIFDKNSTVLALEKRITDLYLLQQSNYQMLPQIRMTQNGNTHLIRQLRAAKVNTIPAWRRAYAMVIAAKEQQETNEFIDEFHANTQALFIKTTKAVTDNAIRIAEANKRNTLEFDTLTQVQEMLNKTAKTVNELEMQGVADNSKMLEALQKRNFYQETIQNNLSTESTLLDIDPKTFETVKNTLESGNLNKMPITDDDLKTSDSSTSSVADQNIK